MRCFNCDYQLLEEAMKNCPICGVSLSNKCSKCNSFNPAYSKFCFECGTELENKTIIHEEKHQKIGVIFADISGFTSLAEVYNPEETKQIINECFEVITEPVYKTGGKIDKFIGDCVMVVFGSDNELDVPFKTIDCALKMRDKMNDYIAVRFPNKEVDLNLSVGATYGSVVLGSVGTRHDSDNTIVGDIVNIASRLQNYAKKGEVLVNDLLYNETKHLTIFNEKKLIKLKNKKDLVPSYGARKMIKNQIMSDIYINREEEQYVNSFLKDNDNTMIQVIGESGCGKTLMGFKISNNIESIFVTQSRIDKEIPYSLLKKIITKFIKVMTDDEQSTVKSKLESYIRFIFNNKEEEFLLRNINFISLLLKLDRKKEFEAILHSMNYLDLENEILNQFNLFLNAAIAINKVAIFVDNSDFIDVKSLSVLTRLEYFKSKFVFISKSKIIDSEETLVLSLGNFTYDQTKTYIEKYFDSSVSDSLIKHLYDLSGGNGFHLSELCKVIDKYDKKYDNGCLQLSEKVIQDLPKTFSVIYSNIYNSLEDQQKKYLQVSSVFKNEFDSKVIFDILGTSFDENIELLLLDLNIIELFSYYRFSGSTYKKYTFRKHDFKTSIYNSLVKKERDKIHLSLGKYYEKLNSDFNTIAFHYEKAGEIKVAKEYVFKQALEFKDNFDLEQSVSQFILYLDLEKSLDRYTVEARVLESLIELSKIMLYKENYQETIHYINEGMLICQTDDELHQLQLLLIEYYKSTSNIGEIFPILDELEKTLQKTSRNYGKLLQLKCTIYNMTGKPGVIEIADKSKEILLRAKDFDSLAETLTQAGIRHFIQGDISSGITYLESALEYVNKGSNKSLTAKILSDLGILYNEFGEREKSHSYFKKSMKISSEISNNKNYTTVAINLGVSYLKSGSFNSSKKALEESVVLSKKSNLLYQLCISLTNLGDVNYELGEYEDSLKSYIQSKELSETMNLPIEIAINDLGILKTNLKHNKTDLSEKVFDEIISVFEEGEEYTYVASAYYALSDYYVINNDLSKALENIEKGILFTEKAQSEEDSIKLKRKKLELMYISEIIEGTHLIFNEIEEKATNSNNFYELTKLYLSRYLYIDKDLHNTKYLSKAEDLSSYFDYCHLTKRIEDETSELESKK